jgi:transposase-like protein
VSEDWAEPLFDDLAFSRSLRLAVERAGGVREVARQAGVSPSTVSRAAQGWPQLSHENWLRLTAWLETPERKEAA